MKQLFGLCPAIPEKSLSGFVSICGIWHSIDDPNHRKTDHSTPKPVKNLHFHWYFWIFLHKSNDFVFFFAIRRQFPNSFCGWKHPVHLLFLSFFIRCRFFFLVRGLNIYTNGTYIAVHLYATMDDCHRSYI